VCRWAEQHERGQQQQQQQYCAVEISVYDRRNEAVSHVGRCDLVTIEVVCNEVKVIELSQ